MLVPFPVEPVRKSRFRTKLFLRQASIEARWLVAADDSTLDGGSEATKSLKPSAQIRGMRFHAPDLTDLSFFQHLGELQLYRHFDYRTILTGDGGLEVAQASNGGRCSAAVLSFRY